MAAAVTGAGVTTTFVLPWFGETLFQRQDLPFSKPQPLPLSAALAEHCGCAEFEGALVLEELLAWLVES